MLPTINNTTSNLSVRIDYVLGRGPIAPQALYLVDATPASRTPSGLWPSDHAGVVATLTIREQRGYGGYSPGKKQLTRQGLSGPRPSTGTARTSIWWTARYAQAHTQGTKAD